MRGSEESSRSVLKRTAIILCIIALVSGSALICFFLFQKPGAELVITDLDVGKADCAVLRYKDITGIIDTAEEDDWGTIEAFLGKEGIDSFDYMILTHYDKDHIGNAVNILEKYQVDRVYVPDYVSGKKHYKKLMEELEGRDDVIRLSQDEDILKLEELEIRVIPAEDPDSFDTEDNNYDNNMSLLSMITYGDSKFFFTGDIEKERISQIIESGEDINADWIKMPHHGSYEKRINKFLKAVSPIYSVISTSADNPPDDKLIAVIDQNSIKNFDTIGGNVVTVGNGRDITVTKE